MAGTIFAQATPPGRSAVAIFRISGPEAHTCASALGIRNVPARVASLRRLIDPLDGRLIDEALVLRFDAPASYTGEDALELQVHGGPAVCRSLAAALAAVPGLRLAEPGEFTRRALLNGRMDLTQAEGVGELLAAETAAQARQALALVEGALSQRARAWRERLIRSLAMVEVAIDHPDEALPADLGADAAALLEALGEDLQREHTGSLIAERIRTGFDIALVGAPNVGKSTLLNALAHRDVALTSEVAGTTRDVIEVRMELQGLPVTVLDMAGVRPTDDRVERMGVERARERARAADLRVFLLDDPADLATLGVAVKPGDQVMRAKGDRPFPDPGLSVSGLTGRGVPELLQRIAAELADRVAGAGTASHARQRDAIERAVLALRQAQGALLRDDLDIAVAEIQLACRALDFLLGSVDVETVLDTVFRSFCLGK